VFGGEAPVGQGGGPQLPGRVRVLADRVLDLVGQPCEMPLEHGKQQRELVGEVQVAAGCGDADLAGDGA
jgi:hypothetical protein